MYFEDLTPYKYYLPYELPSVKNVGWLDGSHPYSRGNASARLLEKMRQIILHKDATFDAHVNPVRGIHSCNLCGMAKVLVPGVTPPVVLGMSEIWIPALSGHYAAPSMILHYAGAHGYLPPGEFIDAVLHMNLDEQYSGQSIYDDLVAQRSKVPAR